MQVDLKNRIEQKIHWISLVSKWRIDVNKFIIKEKIPFQYVIEFTKDQQELLHLVDSKFISYDTAFNCFKEMLKNKRPLEELLKEKKFLSKNEIYYHIGLILVDYIDQIEKYLLGNEKILNFLIGKIVSLLKDKYFFDHLTIKQSLLEVLNYLKE